MYPTVTKLAYAYGKPLGTAKLRNEPEDFYVQEILGFTPEGEGGHVLVQIRKRNANTEWLAKELAKVCKVAPRAVSYAGLKDRQAVTVQWFSIDLGKQLEPNWSSIGNETWQVLHHTRQARKLRRGALRGNLFCLHLREVNADP